MRKVVVVFFVVYCTLRERGECRKEEKEGSGFEGLIRCFAGLGKQNVVGRSVGRERRVGFDHVVEERDGVIEGGD
ncbi:unnamed protein product [Prunus armeniaca]|uniref:Uncharacterized protein n=1 Tax=Prunus armeniaca TaxID=36596 RepID=A0A6J5VFQ1_PRUAR|nr:unnamed protein product [Prunus armeniaca]CAB4318282.1 unnamed protein product [Prunus armeniaca]